MLVSGLGGGGWWVSKVVTTGKRWQPRERALASRFGVGWWWLVGIEGWWQPERSGNPENERLCSFRGVLSEGGGEDGGGVSTEKLPPPSRVSSEGGVVMVVMVCRQRKYPLRLAFRAREGGGEGGVSTENHPLCLAFRAREGW